MDVTKQARKSQAASISTICRLATIAKLRECLSSSNWRSRIDNIYRLSWYYVGFLRYKDDRISPWWRAWNPFRYKCRCFAWSLIHSFNLLTPGIDIDSLTDPFLEEGPFIFRQKIERCYLGTTPAAIVRLVSTCLIPHFSITRCTSFWI